MSLLDPKSKVLRPLAAETLKRMTKSSWTGSVPTESEQVEMGDKFVAELPRYSQNPPRENPG